MSLRRLFLFVCLALPLALPARATQTAAEQAADAYASREIATAPPRGNLPDYALPPYKLAIAQHLSLVQNSNHFAEQMWNILSMVLLLFLGVIGWMRDQAKRFSSNRWAQGYAFTFLFLAANLLLNLPLSIYGQHLALTYQLSTQSWSGWLLDQLRNYAIAWAIGGLLMIKLSWIISKRPRTWWLVFWAAVTPLVVACIFVQPYVIDPLFNTFEPLQRSHPELVAQLEKVVTRGHLNIPADRMFLMKVPDGTTTMNAYVTGFGASKRIVVWDTSLAKGSTDEILLIFSHEFGHYMFGHGIRQILFNYIALLFLLYLGYLFVQLAIARFGRTWRIPSQQDWGAQALLLLALWIFMAAAEPIGAAFTRQQEHEADVYGQEAIHGIVADPQRTALNTFNLLGETALVEPNPNPFIEFWTFNHPAIGRRAAFGKAYNPWAPGMTPKYFTRDDGIQNATNDNANNKNATPGAVQPTGSSLVPVSLGSAATSVR